MLRTKITVFLIVVYMLSLFNVFFPIIRFSSRTYNLMYGNLFMCIPFVLFTIGTTSKPWYSLVFGLLVYGTLAFTSVIVIVFNSYAISHMSYDEVDPSYKILNSHIYGATQVTTYQITGGAIKSYGIDVRQEKVFFKRFLLVKNLFTTSRNENIIIEFKEDHLVIEEKIYPIKENIYF